MALSPTSSHPTTLPPSGVAGGVLDGTFPNPGLAAAVAGAGLAETADVLSVTVDTTTLAITGDTLGLVPAVVGGVVWTVVTKLADESVASSGTLQADDELFFTPVNGGLYEFELDVIYGSPAGAGTPDIGATFGQDATIRGVFTHQGISTGDGAAGGTGQCVNNASVTWGTAAANRLSKMWGVYNGTGAQAGLWWCQNTSGVNATIVRAGSLLRYRRIL